MFVGLLYNTAGFIDVFSSAEQTDVERIGAVVYQNRTILLCFEYRQIFN